MNLVLTPPQTTSPDTRTTQIVGLPAVVEQHHAIDMRQVQEELAAALRHIEDLPRQHPHEASGDDAKSR